MNVYFVSVTEFVYDASGNRLVRRDPSGKTLYLPGGMEVRSSSGAIRYYSHGGAVVAVRTSAGLSWQHTDRLGTAQASIDAASVAVSRRRTMPFGEPRGPQPSGWPGDKEYVGGTSDPTGLTHLGAREYDPAIGRFISVDPVMDASDPQQMNGYAYSVNSPVTLSDPSGLWECFCSGRDLYHDNPVVGYSDMNGMALLGSTNLRSSSGRRPGFKLNPFKRGERTVKSGRVNRPLGASDPNWNPTSNTRWPRRSGHFGTGRSRRPRWRSRHRPRHPRNPRSRPSRRRLSSPRRRPRHSQVRTSACTVPIRPRGS